MSLKIIRWCIPLFFFVACAPFPTNCVSSLTIDDIRLHQIIPKTYILSNTTATWLEAFGNCSEQGQPQLGYLATPINPEVEADIRIYLTTQGIMVDEKIWMGGRVRDGDWIWDTYNLPVLHTNFLNDQCGQPIADHGIYMIDNSEASLWGWCREPETSLLRYVCEYQIVQPTEMTTSSITTVTVTHSSVSTSTVAGTTTTTPTSSTTTMTPTTTMTTTSSTTFSSLTTTSPSSATTTPTTAVTLSTTSTTVPAPSTSTTTGNSTLITPELPATEGTVPSSVGPTDKTSYSSEDPTTATTDTSSASWLHHLNHFLYFCIMFLCMY